MQQIIHGLQQQVVLQPGSVQQLQHPPVVPQAQGTAPTVSGIALNIAILRTF